MYNNKNIFWSLLVLLITCVLYRIIPNRPLGFAPQIAMALFSGAIIKNKKFGFWLPLLSMFLSDVLYEVLFKAGISPIKGFYGGQLTNYALFVGLTAVGFFVKPNNVGQILAGTFIAPTLYYIFSNLLVWFGGGTKIDGVSRYTTSITDGVECFTVALPFYAGSLVATALFGALFFGCYHLFFGRKLAHA
jgi:hypothetical protein